MPLTNMLGDLALDSTTQMANGQRVGQVSTTSARWADGFSGPNLTAGANTLAALAENWLVVRNTGMTITQTNGSLVVVTGTTSDNELLLVGKHQCSIPQNLIAVMMMSTRSASQETRIGYLEIDPATGLPIANANLTNFFNNHCAILFDGTSSSTVKLETLSGSHPSVTSVSIGSQTSSTSTVDYALEVRPEDVTYGAMTANSTSARSSNAARISATVPQISKVYAPFVWVRNTGTASSNTITLQRIISMDIQELQVEVGGGRGINIASAAVPVAVTSVTSITVGNNTATSSSNGASVSKILSAASNNLTLMKSSAGRIFGGYLYNSHATNTAYFTVFNASSTGAVTMGTTVPAYQIALPPQQMVSINALFGQYGIYNSTGLVFAITAGVAETDNTPVAANQVVGTLIFA